MRIKLPQIIPGTQSQILYNGNDNISSSNELKYSYGHFEVSAATSSFYSMLANSLIIGDVIHTHSAPLIIGYTSSTYSILIFGSQSPAIKLKVYEDDGYLYLNNILSNSSKTLNIIGGTSGVLIKSGTHSISGNTQSSISINGDFEDLSNNGSAILLNMSPNISFSYNTNFIGLNYDPSVYNIGGNNIAAILRGGSLLIGDFNSDITDDYKIKIKSDLYSDYFIGMVDNTIERLSIRNDGMISVESDIIPTSGTAIGLYMDTSLTATSNNNRLVGYVFKLTYNTGVYSGVESNFLEYQDWNGSPMSRINIDGSYQHLGDTFLIKVNESVATGDAVFEFNADIDEALIFTDYNYYNYLIFKSSMSGVGRQIQFWQDLLLEEGIKFKTIEGGNGDDISGIATLVGGTVTVNTTKVTANSRIILTGQDLNGMSNFHVVGITARTPGTSFTITSDNVSDTSKIGWFIIEPEI